MMHPLVEQFLDYLALERGLAANSLAAYRRDLEEHLAFLSTGSVDPVTATESDLIRYLTALHHRKAATASISRKLTTSIGTWWRNACALLTLRPTYRCRAW